MFSRPSPTTAAHVMEDLSGRVDVVLDGGSTDIGVESTIVDLTGPPVVLRPGGFRWRRCAKILPTLAYRPQYLPEDVDSAPAPGSLLKHYSPRARLVLFRGDQVLDVIQTMHRTAENYIGEGKKVGVLAVDSDASVLAGWKRNCAVWQR